MKNFLLILSIFVFLSGCDLISELFDSDKSNHTKALLLISQQNYEEVIPILEKIDDYQKYFNKDKTEGISAIYGVWIMSLTSQQKYPEAIKVINDMDQKYMNKDKNEAISSVCLVWKLQVLNKVNDSYNNLCK